MLHNANIPFEERLQAVKEYLQTGQSLRKIACAIGIPYKTLWFWVKKYKEGGAENLEKAKFCKRRLPKDIEIKVMLLKEENPSVSISKARQLLNKTGIKISDKGVWGVWRRYGFVDKKKQNEWDPFGVFSFLTPEFTSIIERAKLLVEKKDYRGAAKILNEPPQLPECQFLTMIPERFLTLRRRLERLLLEYGQIPFEQFLKKARRLRKFLEKKGYIYSSITANFLEIATLDWIGKPDEMIRALTHLSKKIAGVKDSTIWFFFLFLKAKGYACLLRINKSLELIKKLRRLVYRLPFSTYYEHFGILLTTMGEYIGACSFFKKALAIERNQEAVDRLSLNIAIYGYGMAGKYSICKKILTKAENLRNSINLGATYAYARACLSFGQDSLPDASCFFVESLEKAQRGGLRNCIYAATLGLASIARALNKKAEAKNYLKKYLSLMKKYKLKWEELVLRRLANPVVSISKKFQSLPHLCLLDFLFQANHTMKISDYRKAFKFAQRKGLSGLFHRWIVFFPEVILYLLGKGKQTGLPKAILNFPVFNQKIPVYHIKFLGDLIIYKNQEYLKTKLRPKDAAFLIYLCFRTMERGKSINLEEVYANFWSKSETASRNFSHLLIRLKKALKMPTHLFEISREIGNPILVNQGFYFTTDYQEFEQTLAQAKALERAGEWGFARKEYLRAFKLFRGELLKKNYDEWSLNMRHRILTQLETEAVNFAKSCLEHGNKKDARKVLEKVLRIIPDSEEIKNIVERLNSKNN